MQLKLQKLTQRCSELSLFLTNKTNAPYRDKIGQMKPILRFSSMNSLKASYSDAKREYMKLTGG